MADREWVSTLEDVVPQVLELVEDEDEEVKKAVLEPIVEKIVYDGRAQPHPEGSLPQGQAAGETAVGQATDTGGLSDAFSKFVGRHDIEPEDIETVLEPKTGQILAASVGESDADQQRTLAALMAVGNLGRGGDLQVKKEDLREKCKEWGCYNGSNFTSYMDFSHDGTQVFLDGQEGESWRIPRAAEQYIVDRIEHLTSE